MFRLLAQLSLVAVLIVASFSPVRAHPLVDEAQGLYEQAEFEAALARLGQAEARTELTRASLARLLELRALIHFALGDEEAMREDLAALASVAPNHTPSPLSPPALVQALGEQRAQPVRLRLELQEDVVTPVVVDALGLLQGVRLVWRSDTDVAGGWHVEEGRLPRRMLRDGERIEVYAEGVGPGGVVLATAASAQSPRVFGAALEEEVPAGMSLGAKLGIAAGVVVGVALIATAVALAVSGEDRLQPGMPMLEFP